MKQIIITGDSWGVGEWQGTGEIFHNGIAQYFVEDGVDVINLSQGGASNKIVAEHLKHFLKANKHQKSAAIIIFQTEWTRDGSIEMAQVLFEEFSLLPRNTPVYDEFLNIDSSDTPNRFIAAQNKVMSSYYYRLSAISQNYNIPVYVIGGASDTIWLDKFNKEYPGVSILCQSVTNLIMNNNHRIDSPVYSVYGARHETDIALIKKEASAEEFSSVLDAVVRGMDRYDLWRNNREWFYPDGQHPNRKGHKILYDFVKDNLKQ